MGVYVAIGTVAMVLTSWTSQPVYDTGYLAFSPKSNSTFNDFDDSPLANLINPNVSSLLSSLTKVR